MTKLDAMRPEVTMTLESISNLLERGYIDVYDDPAQVKASIDAAVRERHDLWSKWQTERCFRAKSEAEIAALKARTQWQPIETAPKDGTWIYVCRAGQPHSGTKVKFSRDCGGCPESWWDGSGFYRNPTFTHWMPLPPPPKGEE